MQTDDQNDSERGTALETVEVKSHRTCCGVMFKRDAPLSALLTICGLHFTNMCAGVFMSAWVVFLLRDPELGNVPNELIGRVTAQTLLY